MKKLAIAAALAFTMSAPLHAQILLSDNFNAEGPVNAGALNFNLFSNWNVTGAVDLVSQGEFGLNCAGGSGKCIDLDGSPGPGKITTKNFYSFVTGDKMKISYDVSGSQRGNDPDNFDLGLVFSGATNGNAIFATGPFAAFNGGTLNGTTAITYTTSILGGVAFSTWTYEFTALSSGSVAYSFGTNSSDQAGPILDNVVISKTLATSSSTVPEPSTYAMMAVGLLAVVGVSRRRRV